METGNFDRFTKFLGVGTNRRGAMKTLVASALGGVGLAHVVSPVTAQDAPGEEWVQLFEGMAEEVRMLDEDCDTVNQHIQDYRTLHSAEVDAMMADIESWTGEQRAAHQEIFGERIQDASIAVYMALTRCGYKPGSTSPLSRADFSVDEDPAATPVASTRDANLAYIRSFRGLPSASQTYPPEYCDDGCDPGALFTVGNCFLWVGACAGSGDAQDCCWADICVSGFDHAQCVMTCQGCLNLS